MSRNRHKFVSSRTKIQPLGKNNKSMSSKDRAIVVNDPHFKNFLDSETDRKVSSDKPWISQMCCEPLRKPRSYRLSENQLGVPDQKWRQHIQSLQLNVQNKEMEYIERRRQRAIERLFMKVHGNSVDKGN